MGKDNSLDPEAEEDQRVRRLGDALHQFSAAPWVQFKANPEKTRKWDL